MIDSRIIKNREFNNSAINHSAIKSLMLFIINMEDFVNPLENYYSLTITQPGQARTKKFIVLRIESSQKKKFEFLVLRDFNSEC